MKILLLSILSFSLVSSSIYSQNMKYNVGAGYLVGLSKETSQPFDFRGGDNFVNKNGYYVGNSLSSKKYLFSANFVHQTLEVISRSPNVLETKFNYLQIGVQKISKVYRAIDFLYGLSSNVDLNSYSKYTYYTINGERGQTEKFKGSFLNSGPANYDNSNPTPSIKNLTLNLNLAANIAITNKIVFVSNFILPLTPTSNKKSYSFGQGFYQKGITLGINYLLVNRTRSDEKL